MPQMKNTLLVCRLIALLLFTTACSTSYPPSAYDTANIQIARDEYGVPHIFGKTDLDVVYGLAWAHAEDDFETIQKTLLAGKAMAGRKFGQNGAAVDYFVHLLQTREIAAAQYMQAYSPQFVRMIETYAASMNDFALKNPGRVLLQGAFPVTPVDIVSAYILSLAQMSGADQAIKSIVEGKVPEPPIPNGDGGSNAIAIHSSRTTTGQSFLAINSHQPLEGPVSWYEAHLCSEEGWNIIGGLFPGGLTVFHGANEHLGWAHTVNYPDKLDAYKLEMHDDGKQYKMDGQWLPLEERKVWLWVKLWDIITVPIPKKVWQSMYGPTMVTDHGAYSIRTGALHRIGAPEQWYHMNKAKSFNEFYKAMSAMELTAFNTVYADRYDTIFYVDNALLPVRTPGYDYTTTLPGNTRSTYWDTFHTFAELPQLVNPKCGYLYNTNHSPFLATHANENLDPAAYPVEMGNKVWDNNRSVRFRELMPDTGLVDYASFKQMKFDYQLPNTLHYESNVDVLFHLNAEQYPELADQIDLLQSWDKRASPDSKGAAQFAYCYYYLRDSYKANGQSHRRTVTESEALVALRSAKEHFTTYFGTATPMLGDYQKLVRGGKELPLFGLPDVLAAMRSEAHENGKRKGDQGESYILMAQFGSEGVVLESVNVYGASTVAGSPHHTDQMELFNKQQLKPMTLEKAKVLASANRVYRPGE